MMMEEGDNPIVVMTTCPDGTVAENLAGILVERKLAACIQISPGVKSIYMWEGSVQSESEHLLFIKTISTKYSELEKTIKEHHPYEVPEILAIEASHISDDYLDWMTDVL